MHRKSSGVTTSSADDLLYGIVGRIWSSTGENFLTELVRQLAAALDARIAMIGELLPGSSERMRSVTACLDGRIADNFEYDLPGTPCENVMAKEICYYPSDIAQQFPQDKLLVEMGMDSYLGAPLIGRGGQALGLLAVLHDRPLRDPEQARTLIQFCAIRAAAELEYLRMVGELRKSELRYRALFDAANEAILVGRHGRVEECNPQALQLFRATAETIAGKTIEELSPELQPDGRNSLEKARELTKRVLAGEPLLAEWKCRRLDGTLFDAELSINALEIGGERLLQCLVRDISEGKRARLELEQAEERFEKAFRLSPEPMSIHDIDGRYVDINEVALEKLGLRREEVIGRTGEELGVDLLPAGDLLSEFRKSSAIRNREWRVRSRSGAVLILLLSAELIHIGGEPHILVMAPDVTERVCAEYDLLQSEERFKKAFRSSPIPMAIARLHGGIVDANDRLVELFGIPLTEGLGKTADELGVSVEPAARLREEFQRAGFKIRNRETQYRTRAGELRTFLLSVELIQLQGEPDITEQKQNEEAMRMLSSAVTVASDAIIITDNDLNPTPRVLYANPAFTQLTGYTSEELIGRRTSDTFGTRIDSKSAAEIQQALSRGDEFHGEIVNSNKDGRIMYMELDIVSVRDSTGRITNYVAVRRDISRRKAEEFNRQRFLHLVFEAQTEERRRISRELHDHAGQLLTSMLLRLEALKQETAMPSVKQAIGELSSVASSTMEELSRLARGLHPTVLDDLGLAEAFRRTLDEFEGAGITARMSVCGLQERLPQNVEHEIYQIVKEALTNVRKHSQARHLVLSLEQQGSLLAVSVADDGVGFDCAVTSAARTGLGIIGMNERTALLHGTLRVHSRPNAGTVINLTVPLASTEALTE